VYSKDSREDYLTFCSQNHPSVLIEDHYLFI